MQEHENIRNMHRSEDREEGNIRCLISIRAQRSAGRARGQEEEAGVEEREVEGPGQSASVCESAVEGTKGQKGGSKRERGVKEASRRTSARDKDGTSPGITTRARGERRERGWTKDVIGHRVDASGSGGTKRARRAT